MADRRDLTDRRPAAPFSAGWFAEKAGELGGILLVGGLVGAILCLLQAAGLFQDALAEVMAEDRFLDRLREGTLEDLWVWLSRRLFLRRRAFPVGPPDVFESGLAEALRSSLRTQRAVPASRRPAGADAVVGRRRPGVAPHS